MKLRAVLILVFLTLLSLSVNPALTQDETRPFYMGFTPFPYEISLDAVTYTYDRIAQDADLIAHHFDNGVPWVEALNGDPYGDNIWGDWELRRSRTPEDHQVLVTISPINFSRTGLATYRGEQDDMPLPAPFDGYGFDHPDVEKAFLKYAEDILTYFNPDYFLIGIEVNLLMKLRPDLWDSYVALHRSIYTQLKATHPDLPIMISMTGIDLLEGYTDVDHAGQVQALNDLIDYTDLLGISLYPYMTAYMTNSIPTEIFDQLAALTDKPIAITETGYPAQDFGINAEEGLRLEFDSDETKQADYIRLLLEAAREHQFRFIINFVLRDYDALWQQIGGREDLTIAWRDTGLYDEAGGERPALAIWREYLQMPVSPNSNALEPLGSTAAFVVGSTLGSFCVCTPLQLYPQA
jgi:hypothetical protein